MRRVVIGVLLTIGLLTAGCTWWLMSYGPDTPAEYAEEYGGNESSYRNILNMDDCQLLAQRAADMDERYNRASESRETKRMALGFQSAAVDRMVELDCP